MYILKFVAHGIEHVLLIVLNPSRPNPGQNEKIKLNFYFHLSLWCLKRFYEVLEGLHKNLLRHHKKV